MSKHVLVPIAEGFEMIEALTVVDIFRRASVKVDLVSIAADKTVVSSHQVSVVADKLISDCVDENYDLIVLPGGVPGVDNLQKSQELKVLLEKQNNSGKLYGAICAAPAVVLEAQGLLEGKAATCHPLFTDRLSKKDKIAEAVVVDGNCVTSRGAGTALEFALKLLEMLLGMEARKEVEQGLAI